ncbi:MAG: hypothetical protein BGO67_11920 [Alphaproteobacteria bacterium 41-28]|nr:MAG: hypothetical protein BGO67_11920 [Alphaproteobacteria bacterium 41-28]
MKKVLLSSIAAMGFFGVIPQTKSDRMGICPTINSGVVGATENGLKVFDKEKTDGNQVFSKVAIWHPATQVIECFYNQGAIVSLTISDIKTYSFSSCTFNNAERGVCTISREGCVITCNKR